MYLAVISIHANPNLDLAADSDAFPLLRRHQTRTGTLLPHQHLPVRVGELEVLKTDSGLSQHDRYSLKNQFPLGDTPKMSWRDTSSGNSLYFRPQIIMGYQDTSIWSLDAGPGARIYGTVTDDIVYYTRAYIFTENTGKDQFAHQFDPDYGETCSAEIKSSEELSKSRSCARFESWVLWDFSWMSLKMGRDRLHMGPGYFSSLTQSRDTAPFYLTEMRIKFSPWLTIDNYLLRMVDSKHDIQKYAHIHRFEFKPTKSLAVAFQDIVIYQEKDVDLKYVIPLTPLALSEDNTGGLDNDALSFDFLYSGFNNVSLWGELFVDDLLGPATLFDDFWENRFSFLTGMQITAPYDLKGLPDMDLVLEYQRVEPWTYTGRQSYTSFRHFDKVSASQIGPNSHVFDVAFSWRPLKYLEFTEHYKFSEKGTDRGSSHLDIHDRQGFEDSDTKEFLGGNVNTSHRYTHSLSGRFNQNLIGRFFLSNNEDWDEFYFGVRTEVSL